MSKSYLPFSFSLGRDDANQRDLITQQLKVRGSGRAPDPPRDLQAQPGARGALVTWKLPASGTGLIRGWRVYKDTESNLEQEIHDVGQRQLYVALSSGEVPPPTNVFVSAISAAGAESAKVVIKAVALSEIGAPIIPPPPPGYGDEGAGGKNRKYY